MEMKYGGKLKRVMHGSPEAAISLLEYIDGKNDGFPDKSPLMKRLAEESGFPSNNEFYDMAIAAINWEKPRFAVLQPGDAGSYEVIYISDEVNINNPMAEAFRIHEYLNSSEPRPDNFYGYSLDEGDILVFYGNEEFMSYKVNSFGFSELADFPDEKTEKKILACLDIRKERNLLANLSCSMTLPRSLEERLECLNRYNPVFELADSRKVNTSALKTDPFLGSLQEVNMSELDKSTTYFAVGKESSKEPTYSLFCLNYTLPVKSVFSDRFSTPDEAKRFLLNMTRNNPGYRKTRVKLVSLNDLNRIQRYFFERSEEIEESLNNRINEIKHQLQEKDTKANLPDRGR